MQVCTSLQTDNHASTPITQVFTGRMPFLPPNQQQQSTEGRILTAAPDFKPFISNKAKTQKYRHQYCIINISNMRKQLKLSSLSSILN